DSDEQLRTLCFRYKAVAVLHRSVRPSSTPLIDVLKERGIPFRAAGRTGLFLQPEASVLGKTYAWLSKNDWKNERYGQSEPVDLPGLVNEYQAVFARGAAIPGLKEYLADWQGM